MAEDTMWAAVYREAGRLSYERVPVPRPGPGELIVRLECCGLCGTDLKKIHYGLQPGPRIFGHEMAGAVWEVSAGVSEWVPGDRVAVLHHVACGDCYFCNRGLDAQCPSYKNTVTTAGFTPAGGGLAQYVRVMKPAVERGLIRLPDEITSEEASFIEPVNTCLKGVERSATVSEDTLVVLGLGPIGLLLAALSKQGGRRVVGVDPVGHRCETARSLLNVAAFVEAGASTHIMDLTDGRGADAAIVATPAHEAIEAALRLIRPGGRVVLFANTRSPESAPIDVGAVCAGEREIVGSYSSSMNLVSKSAQLVFGRLLPLRQMITDRFPLSDINEALALAMKPPPGTLKVMVEMGLSDH
jgi:L-iditol 2-dehydrogenase